MKKIFLKKFSFETISLRTKGGLLHMTGISCARDEFDIEHRKPDTHSYVLQKGKEIRLM